MQWLLLVDVATQKGMLLARKAQDFQPAEYEQGCRPYLCKWRRCSKSQVVVLVDASLRRRSSRWKKATRDNGRKGLACSDHDKQVPGRTGNWILAAVRLWLSMTSLEIH